MASSKNTICLSVYIITKNEADRMIRCLESVFWADEIVVVDSGSTDDTVKIAKTYTDKVFKREWKGFVKQKNEALELTSGDWALNIDSDEIVSEELRHSIEEALNIDIPEDINGFIITRKVNYLGKWIYHSGWYLEHKLRLTRKGKGKWIGDEVHEKLEVTGGRAEKLEGVLYHTPYRSISDHLKIIDRYSTIGARTLYKSGGRFRLLDLLIRPPLRFFKMFVLKSGFLDGVHGIILGIMGAYYVFLKYAKLWKIENEGDCDG